MSFDAVARALSNVTKLAELRGELALGRAKDPSPESTSHPHESRRACFARNGANSRLCSASLITFDRGQATASKDTRRAFEPVRQRFFFSDTKCRLPTCSEGDNNLEPNSKGYPRRGPKDLRRSG